ncbi:hypothetical protein HHI36_023483 [Cryptolaemus montrouzieri]|uniref:Ribosomal protein eL8/eL30/eS12/Gadd45 domain-containing protein n=1 Tax=Cryptolaemus montrouzieri TaxID=559131 RepID=A0ABD2PGJ7_9CUCU
MDTTIKKSVEDQPRFPDIAAYEEEIRRCNLLATPLGTRIMTNKCYALLRRAQNFPACLFTGVREVHGMLESPLAVSCIVILAADTNIDGLLKNIPLLCLRANIPYIFIPNKAYIREALHLRNEVLAVLITFEGDSEFQRLFQLVSDGIRSQCFDKRRGYYPCTSGSTVVGPSGEMVSSGLPSSSNFFDQPSTSGSSVVMNIPVLDIQPDSSTSEVPPNGVDDHSSVENNIGVPLATSTPGVPISNVLYLNDEIIDIEIDEAFSPSSPSAGPGHGDEEPQNLSATMVPSSTTDCDYIRKASMPPYDGSGEGPDVLDGASIVSSDSSSLSEFDDA